MPTYKSPLLAEQMIKANSGAHYFFNEGGGYSGDARLMGNAYVNYINASGLAVQNSLFVTGSQTVFGNFTGHNFNHLANIVNTGTAYIENLTGNTVFNRVNVTGDSLFRKSSFSGDMNVTGDVRVTGEFYINGLTITGLIAQNERTGFLTGDFASLFNNKGDLLVGTGVGQHGIFNTGGALSGSSLIYDPSQPMGVRWGGVQQTSNPFTFTSGANLISISGNHPGNNKDVSVVVGTNNSFFLGHNNTAQPFIGVSSVDIQLIRISGQQTTMGNYSFAAGARNIAAGGDFSSVIGVDNKIYSSAAYSFVGGSRNHLSNYNDYAVVLGRDNSIYEGGNCVVIGNDNELNSSGIDSLFLSNFGSASENRVVGIGYEPRPKRYGEVALSSSLGTQTSIMNYWGQTTNDTEREIFSAGSDNKRVSVASGSTLAFTAYLVGRRSTGTQSAAYKFEGVIKNDGGTTAFVGTPVKTVMGEDDAAWDANMEADNTNNALVFKVTGAAATTIRWGASVYFCEVSV